MGTKQTQTEKSTVRNSEIWRSEEGAKGYLLALQLSYDHLLPHLKQCFAYCSVFPKGYRIGKLMLIQLWIAQRFILSKGGMQVEDIGNRYLELIVCVSITARMICCSPRQTHSSASTATRFIK